MGLDGATQTEVEWGGGYRSLAFLLAVLLTFGSIITSRQIEDDERDAIWRNTEHTASMLSSLLQDQMQAAAEKLALLHEIHGNDPQLVAVVESDNIQGFERRAALIKQNSLGLVDGVFLYAADGQLLFASHQGRQAKPSRLFRQARQTGKPAFGLEMLDDDHLHVVYAGAMPGSTAGVPILGLSSNLNNKLEVINRLLRLEMEQHAATGEPGDTAFGVFRMQADSKRAKTPVVTAGNFPRTELNFVYELLARGDLRGETGGHQFRVVPLTDESGTAFAAAVLALDVTSATAAGRIRANRFLALLLLGSASAVLLFYFLLARDARRRKEHTEQLSAALAAAESATRAKSEFLANMSHEIRTPMNAVIGLTNLCLREALSDKVRDYVSKTRGAGEHLLGIINDILDISKVEAGKLVLDDIDFDLDEVIDNVAGVCGMVAADKALDILIDVDPRTPRHMRGDPLRLGQVLNNLLGNAIKFTEQGRIVLRAAPLGDGSGLRFTVSDTGIGLSAGQIEQLFKAFSQVDNSATRKYGGTGLGLVISQRLVELMGGRIEVESAPGRGSRFSFTLAGRFEPALPGEKLAGRRITVVDDDPEHARIVAGTLAALGANVAVNPPGERPCDLAIVTSARGLSAELANRNAKYPVLHLANLRANGAEERSRVQELHRPVTRRSLEQAVFRALRLLAEDPGVQELAAGAAGEFKGFRILVVEDNPLNQFVARDLLGMTGATLKIAENGLEAIQAVISEAWDLVLMDVQMPVMDGITATKAIRRQFGSGELPIIAMTAHAIAEERERCLAAGMNDFVSKPVDFPALVNVMRRWLGTADAGAAGAAGGSVVVAGVGEIHEFDHEVAMHYAMGETARMMTLIEAYLRTNLDTPARLREHARDNEREKVRQLAHRLKGTSAYVGAAPLGKFAEQVEIAAREGHEDWREQVNRLAEGVERLTGRLAEVTPR